MKRIIAALAACMLIVSLFAGCGVSDPLESRTAAETATEEKTSTDDEAKKAANSTYTDSFDSVAEYLTDKEYLNADSIKNASDGEIPTIKGVSEKYGYEIIGASKGMKYTKDKISIEVYYFDNPDTNEYVQSVKKNGSFALYDIEIKACLALDGKYMMIYSDPSAKDNDTESDAYKKMQQAIEDFEAFKPAK